MKGFTLIELLISVIIMGFLVWGLLYVFQVGRAVYDSNVGLMDMKKMARQTMQSMVKELRQAKVSDISISAGSSQVDFILPKSINPITYSKNIRYSVDNNRLIREHPPGNQQILATGIDALTFTINGNMLEIELSVKFLYKKHQADFTLKETIALRS